MTAELEARIAALEQRIATLERMIDGIGDSIRPRSFPHGQVRLDKFSGERHG
tara:strand:- start:499 stop:654 length:156 start_codon:yes stop_codon:yes gene_type:complete